jgi:hypothetical protein
MRCNSIDTAFGPLRRVPSFTFLVQLDYFAFGVIANLLRQKRHGGARDLHLRCHLIQRLGVSPTFS